ncbi:glycosyltransferase family 2 protein [Wenzhouxiangella sp. AB-CW3]|uniref:glycosyltransferase family 2 protein n=1 Tax=Wenzhouxiangella sp. AB-CW3 TaxID=2771012 RepID=UPI00168BE17D|nr:glycosyltransferase family 2 protein [Wenzhouxiangella sp. AB-CW3]QOC23059.1 glycosyltransferase family 2 protein [Wenzhouxiangella sp. AB-CW3]
MTGGTVTPLARVTAVIVNYNSGPWLERCINQLRGRNRPHPSVIVIDNASTDGSIERLPALEDLVVRRARRNLGFGRGVNQALRSIATEYLLVINPDCLIVPDALLRLVDELDRHPQAALVSGRVFDMSGNEQRGSRRRLPTREQVLGEVLPFSRRPGIDLTGEPAPVEAVEVEAVSGACMLIRTRALQEVGGFDPAFHMHFEDLDLMARFREAGWSIRLDPGVIVSHAGGVSSRQRAVGVMLAKHRSLWRYLNKHCADDWSLWSRWLWKTAIVAHAMLRLPLELLKR